MDRYEEAVMEYITGSNYRFVNPQFAIPYIGGKGGSDPDFVVVDVKEKTVYVVEVTTASNTNSIFKRIQERQQRWLEPLHSHFEAINPDMGDWEYRVTVFVRESACERLKKKLHAYEDVSIFSIEEVSFPYAWSWNDQNPENPLK